MIARELLEAAKEMSASISVTTLSTGGTGLFVLVVQPSATTTFSLIGLLFVFGTSLILYWDEKK